MAMVMAIFIRSFVLHICSHRLIRENQIFLPIQPRFYSLYKKSKYRLQFNSSNRGSGSVVGTILVNAIRGKMTAPTVPMSVSTRQEFLDLLFLYKQKLVPYLPPLEVTHTSISKTVTNHPSLPRVKVTHTYTVKKTAQAGPLPIADTMEDTMANLHVYSLAELWSAVTKHFAGKQIANPSFASKFSQVGEHISELPRRKLLSGLLSIRRF
ncbi:hypothetical protein BGX38DRAFT_1223652 [Terfezia claveryi]|nr:hypothetical protein BGX38DRAFT_1223652 [Terfezia claveryi]